jgi:hypothetical protein
MVLGLRPLAAIVEFESPRLSSGGQDLLFRVVGRLRRCRNARKNLPYSFQEALYCTSRCTDGTLTFPVDVVLFSGHP